MKVNPAHQPTIETIIATLTICCSCTFGVTACSTVGPQSKVNQTQTIDPHPGEASEIQAFSRVTLKQLRDELPRYPNASFYPKPEEEKEADGGDNIVFVCRISTVDSLDKAAAFYGKELKAEGWRVFGEKKPSADKHWLFAKKGYKGILVVVEPDQEHKSTALTVIKGWQTSDDTLRIEDLSNYSELK